MQEVCDSTIQEIVQRALAEDVGTGDITTAALVGEDRTGRGVLIAKESAVVAGLALFEATLRALDPSVKVSCLVGDGARVSPGLRVAEAEGKARALLTGERTALNFVQRMSGIATLTARYVEAVRGTGVKILDTRKTAPGLRVVDKWAVRIGGGTNHRMGLFDAILIKDNHLRLAGGIAEAVRRARAHAPAGTRVEVEAQSLAEVEEAVAAGADLVMLDNMSVEEVKRAVAIIGGRARIEVSGGVTLETVRQYAECGVDYISVGELTHSARAVDFSFELACG